MTSWFISDTHFGHKNQDTTRIDVSVDSEIGQYYPRSYSELKKVMQGRTYKVVDGHGKDEDLNE